MSDSDIVEDHFDVWVAGNDYDQQSEDSASSSNSTLSLESTDDNKRDLTQFELLESDFLLSYYESLVEEGLITKPKGEKDLGKKLKKQKKIQQARDWTLGLSSSNIGKDANTIISSLRVLIALRCFPKKSPAIDLYEKRILVVNYLSSRLAAQPKIELHDMTKPLYVSEAPPAAGLGFKTSFRIVFAILNTISISMPDVRNSVLLTLDDLIKDLPISALRDQGTRQLDSLYYEAITSVEKWLYSIVDQPDISPDMQKKIGRMAMGLTFATATLEDLLSLLSHLLQKQSLDVSMTRPELERFSKWNPSLFTDHDILGRKLPFFRKNDEVNFSEVSITCDGDYIYLKTPQGLIKFGNGYGIRWGAVHGHRKEFFNEQGGDLVFLKNKLFYRPNPSNTTLHVLDLDLKDLGTVEIPKIEGFGTTSHITSDNSKLYLLSSTDGTLKGSVIQQLVYNEEQNQLELGKRWVPKKAEIPLNIQTDPLNILICGDELAIVPQHSSKSSWFVYNLERDQLDTEKRIRTDVKTICYDSKHVVFWGITAEKVLYKLACEATKMDLSRDPFVASIIASTQVQLEPQVEGQVETPLTKDQVLIQLLVKLVQLGSTSDPSATELGNPDKHTWFDSGDVMFIVQREESILFKLMDLIEFQLEFLETDVQRLAIWILINFLGHNTLALHYCKLSDKLKFKLKEVILKLVDRLDVIFKTQPEEFAKAMTRQVANVVFYGIEIAYPNPEDKFGIFTKLVQSSNSQLEPILQRILERLQAVNLVKFFPEKSELSISDVVAMAENPMQSSAEKGGIFSDPERTRKLLLEFVYVFVRQILTPNDPDATPAENDLRDRQRLEVVMAIVKESSKTVQLLAGMQSKGIYTDVENANLLRFSVFSILPYLLSILGVTENLNLILLVTEPFLELLQNIQAFLKDAPVVSNLKEGESVKTPVDPKAAKDKKEEKEKNWMIELKNFMGVVMAKSSCQLIVGPPSDNKELASASMLSSPVFSNGRETSEISNAETSFLRDLMNEKQEDLNRFFFMLRERTLSPVELQVIKRTQNPLLDSAEKYVIAALLKHHNLTSFAMYAASNSSQENLEELIPLWRAAYRTRRWIIQEHQASGKEYEELCQRVKDRATFILTFRTFESQTLDNPPTPSTPNSRSLLKSSGSIPRWKITASDLRSWADFFSVWKSRRQMSASPDRITDDIFSYLTGDSDIEPMLKTRNLRMRSRVSGLKTISMLLHLVDDPQIRKECVRYLTLGVRGNDTLSNRSHHYLQDLAGIGTDGTSEVTTAWRDSASKVIELLRNENLPADVRTVCLNFFNLELSQQDGLFLLEKDFFRIPFENSPKLSNFWQTEWILHRLIVLELLKESADSYLSKNILDLHYETMARLQLEHYSGDSLSHLANSKKIPTGIEDTCVQILLLWASLSQNKENAQYLARNQQLEQLFALIKHGPDLIKTLSFRLLRNLMPHRQPEDLGHLVIDEKSVVSFLFELIGLSYATSSTVFKKKMKVTVRLSQDIITMAAESLTLLRSLMHHSDWNSYLSTVILAGLEKIPSLVSGEALNSSTTLTDDTIWSAVASLCIIGGDIETLRLGGRVTFKSGGKASPVWEQGTLVQIFSESEAKILLDNTTSIFPIKKKISDLTPIREVEVNLGAIGLPDLIPLYKLFFTKSSQSILFLQLKARLMKVLIDLMNNHNNVGYFVEAGLFPQLLNLALQPVASPNDVKSNLNLEQLERVSQTLQHILLSEKATAYAKIGVAPKVRKLQKQIDVALENNKLTKSQYRELRIEFSQLDLDGDGEVTLEEFQEANRRRGSPVSQKDLEKMKEVGNSLNFLDFVEVVLGKKIWKRTASDPVFQVHVKNPLQLAGSYECTQSEQGPKFPEDGIAAKIGALDETNPSSVSGKIVLLTENQNLQEMLKLASKMGAVAAIVIANDGGFPATKSPPMGKKKSKRKQVSQSSQGYLSKLLENFKSSESPQIPVAMLSGNKSKLLWEYIQGKFIKEAKKEDQIPNYVDVLTNLGYDQKDVKKALSASRNNISAAAYWLKKNVVREDEEKKDEEKEDEKDEKKDEKKSKKKKEEILEEGDDDEDEAEEGTPEENSEENSEDEESHSNEDGYFSAEEVGFNQSAMESVLEEILSEGTWSDEEMMEEYEESDDEAVPIPESTVAGEETYFSQFIPKESDSDHSDSESDEDDDDEEDKKKKVQRFNPLDQLNLKNPHGEVIQVETILGKLYSKQSLLTLLGTIDPSLTPSLVKSLSAVMDITTMATTSTTWCSPRVNLSNKVEVPMLYLLEKDTRAIEPVIQEIIGYFLIVDKISEEDAKKLPGFHEQADVYMWILKMLTLASQPLFTAELVEALLLWKVGGEKFLQMSRILTAAISRTPGLISEKKGKELLKKLEKRYQEEHSQRHVIYSRYLQNMMEFVACATSHMEESGSEANKEIVIKPASPCASVKDKYRISSKNYLNSFVVEDLLLTSGLWYYEVVIDGQSIGQMGWVTSSFRADGENGKGVGDDANSWGYDGCRQYKWHNDEHVIFNLKIIIEELPIGQCSRFLAVIGRDLGLEVLCLNEVAIYLPVFTFRQHPYPSIFHRWLQHLH
eukprot:TRINITY_DN6494_c0_g1_i6.p1 TRINITY_DN6494_c0_g1~~TRINITY_DN6494_c0_g1_i6.p1  ORF type:complete len:2585 (+),score=892.52 TRINITY_DN6494_c0_g1_i6:21-7775(+)